MSNNLTESGRKAAELKAQKRAAALRENLKRRKNSEALRAGMAAKGEKNAEPENRE